MRYNLFIFLCFYTLISFSQTILSGTIKGSDGTILENVNILAFPINSDANMAFATSKKNGDYTIELKSNIPYKITLSHMGYITFNGTLNVKQNSIRKDFTLQLDPNVLSEVVIEYTPPVKVRKDTITYNIEKFTNGNERKLREVLKKLPGVTVDKDGNVESQGKKVTQVLVENKKFFNGNTKMAVNNIPADVIKEVEIIEDYHETAFMKGLDTSEEIALNINLKDDKKNFVFGDLEAGSGIEERYKIHPSLFKYGTKATYNIIGDFNNTDEKSFTLKDLIDFEGGFDSDNFTKLYASPLAQFLRTENFIENKHLFGALNVQFNPNDKNEFRVFTIAMADKSLYKNTNTNTFIVDNTTEFRDTEKKDDLKALFAKIHYKFTGSDDTELKIEGGLDLSDLKGELFNTSQFDNNNFNFETNKQIEETKTSITTDYKNKINRKNTITSKVTYNYSNENELNNWLSEDNLFNTTIPIQNVDFYSIINPTTNKNNILNANFKYYWILNRKTHVNFGVNNEYLSNNFDYNNFQELDNGTQNNFENFENNTHNTYNKLDFYLKFKQIFGDFLLESKVTFEQNNWKSEQSTINFKKSKSFVLPNFSLTWEPDNKKELKISYKNESRFFNFSNSVASNQIRGFNSIFLGNENLPLSNYEVFSINYKNYKTYSISYYPSFTYRKRTREIVNQTILNGIYNTTSPIVINLPNQSYYLRLRTRYNRKYYNINFTPSYEIYNYKSIINNTITKNENLTFSTNLGFQTNFEENVNYDFSVSYANRINNSNTLKSTVNTTNLYLGLSHELEEWIFKMDGSQTYFNSKNANSRNSNYNTFNCSVLYHKEDNPWSFEIKARNILNNRSNIRSSFNGITLEQQETFVFPRYLLFNAYYKL